MFTSQSLPISPPHKDLINFLNQSGPLHRTIDKDRTSPKVYDTLMADEKARDEQAKKANERVRRRMPIMGNGRGAASGLDALVGGPSSGEAAGTVGDAEDGSMTMRTTNFSTVDRSNIFEGFGVNRRTLFDISTKLNGINSSNEEWKNLISREYLSLLSKEKQQPNSSARTRSQSQMDQDLALLQNALKYISLPVLMRDAEEDVIGTFEEKVKELQFVSGMRVAREGSLEFVLVNEDRV